MKRLVAPLLVLALLVSVLLPGTAVAQSKYESGLYWIVLVEHGPNWQSQSTEVGAQKKMQAINGLKNAIGEGAIITAGLVVDDVAADFVMIVSEGHETVVRRALKSSPLVQSGFYKMRALAWHAPKGLKLEPIPLKK
ncbi:hypothetical protein DRQ50_03095 [bacterium]|nr:MAG: hypothetical protein DRQ50_03095 [bacterium]